MLSVWMKIKLHDIWADFAFIISWIMVMNRRSLGGVRQKCSLQSSQTVRSPLLKYVWLHVLVQIFVFCESFIKANLASTLFVYV